jgi:hypothetical protein
MAKPSSSPGYKTTAETCELLGRTQPCVLGYIRDGQLTGEKGADGHWYISELSINAFLQRRNLTSGARALTEVDNMAERLTALEAKVEKLTAGMKVMLAHMKGAPPAKED